jgi:hypothetical protein
MLRSSQGRTFPSLSGLLPHYLLPFCGPIGGY